jgi:hypothetical protein
LGGKSFLARVVALTYCAAIPKLQAWIVRRSFGELESTFWHGPDSLPSMASGLIRAGLCRTVGLDLEFYNQARIHCTHFEHETDGARFEGAEIHILIVDELTSFSFAQYQAMKRRCRLGSLAVPERYRAKLPWLLSTGTPGGIGHSWVKEYFIEGSEPFAIRDIGGTRRQFIPARITDNPTALANDPSYVAKLKAAGDPAITEAKLYGNWDVVAGSMFSPPFRRETHVVRAFAIPLGWEIVRGCDDGFAAPLSAHWVATDPVYLRSYVIGELYKEGLLPEKAAALILERDARIEREDAYGEISPNSQRLSGIIDCSSFTDYGSGSASRGRVMNTFGCKWEPCIKYPGSRVHRIQHLSRMLALQKDGWPKLLVFDSCPVLIKAISGAPRDTLNPEDVAEGYQYQHALDSATYGLSVKDRSFRRVPVSGI